MKNLKSRIEHFIDEETGEIIVVEFTPKKEKGPKRKMLKMAENEEN